MNWLDWVIAAILLVSAALGARRGLARQIIGLAAWVLAFVFAMWFYGTASVFVRPYMGPDHIANLVGFLLVVLGVILCGNVFGWIVSRFLKSIGLSFFDRLLGAIFGLLRGALIAMVLLTAYITFAPADDETMNGRAGTGQPTGSSAVLHSQIAPYLLEASHVAVMLAPMELKSGFQKQYAALKATLKEIRSGSKGTSQGK